MKEQSNGYVVLLQKYYANCSKNIEDIELQVMYKFFNRMPVSHQKAMFNKCTRECEFFPKLCKVEKFYDEYLRFIRQNKDESNRKRNEKFCENCNDTGLCVYYSNGSINISRDEYYKRFNECRNSFDKYMCACYCNNGQNMVSENIAGYQLKRKEDGE